MALVSKAFGDIITFTRASSATFVNSAGLITSATTDAPRFDYDPATLAAKGLLIEESRTNLHLYSQDFSTGWNSPASSTLTPAAVNGLDGTLSAASFVCSDTLDTQRRLHASANITVSPTGTYTASCYVKPVNGWIWVSFSVTGGTVVTNGIGGGTFNLSTGALGTTTQTAAGASGVTKSIFPAGNGWYRIVVSGTMDGVVTNLRPKIVLLDADESYAAPTVGVVGAGVYVYGMQLEEGAFPTSYIPTTAAAVTRAVDVAVISTLSPWFNATEGTLYAQFDTVTSGSRTITSVNDETANEFIRLRSSSTNPFLHVVDGGVDQAEIDAGTIASYTSNKFAGAYKANDFAACISGGTVQTDTSGSLPTVTQLQLGRQVATTYLNGHLQRITYYPRRLTDVELQSITA